MYQQLLYYEILKQNLNFYLQLLNLFSHPDGSALFSAQLDPMLVLLASVVACGVGLAAAAIPARSAARMDPVQAIRA